MTPPTPTDSLDFGNASQMWSAGAATLAFILSIVAFSRQRNDKALDELKKSQAAASADLKADIKELRDDDARQFERIDKMEADLAAVKADVRHLPTRDEVHRIDVKITEIGARIEARFEALDDKMDTAISQMQRAQDRLAEREDRIK